MHDFTLISQGELQKIEFFNAQDKQQWIHLLPAGLSIAKDGRKLNALNLDQIIAETNKRSGFQSIPVDYDHQLDLAQEGQAVPAAGWITQFEARDNGIWGLAEWTTRAFNMVKDKEYRFISPVIIQTPQGQVIAILRAALTNNPALDLISLNSSKNTLQDNTFMENNPNEIPEKSETSNFIQQLQELLDLPESVDEQQIIKAVKKLLTSRNSVDPAQYVPIELFENAVKQINILDSGISQQAAEREVRFALKDKKLTPWMKDWAIELCTVNKPAFDSFLENIGGKVYAFNKFIETPIDGPWKHLEKLQSPVSAEQKEVLETLGITEEDHKKYGETGK
jgi:Mu-like prophage I protein